MVALLWLTISIVHGAREVFVTPRHAVQARPVSMQSLPVGATRPPRHRDDLVVGSDARSLASPPARPADVGGDQGAGRSAWRGERVWRPDADRRARPAIHLSEATIIARTFVSNSSRTEQ